MTRSMTTALAALIALLLSGPALAGPLNVLLTNDDGWNAPGIQAVRAALLAAGHDVLLVAPLTGQSGAGGGLSTDVGGFVNVVEQAPGQWSVDSTPSDAVRAALGAVLPGLGRPVPDVIVSGCNFGQNLAQTGSNASGTIGAALQGLFSGVPSVACSVGLDFAEAGLVPPFPSTFAAFAPAGDFVVRLLERLDATRKEGDGLLPGRTLLNVNVPVPYGDVQGVRFTRLAQQSNFEIVWQDVLNVIPGGGGPVLLNVAFPAPPDPVKDNDTDAHRAGFITITTLDGDMTARPPESVGTRVRLQGLEP